MINSSVAAAAIRHRFALPGGSRQTSRASTPTSTASAAPQPPDSQGRLDPGSALKNLAVAAIQPDGSQAAWATSAPRTGATGMVTQATRPSTVASGAAGAARMFATTP